MKRNATAVWIGSFKEGAGVLTTQSKVLNETQYSAKSRFEEGIGTNPEELVAAAHSGCFSMQLSAYISEEGFEVITIQTESVVEIEAGTVLSSKLTVKAKVKGITDDKFQELVTKAEKTCPISKLLNAAISSTATLE